MEFPHETRELWELVQKRVEKLQEALQGSTGVDPLQGCGPSDTEEESWSGTSTTEEGSGSACDEWRRLLFDSES